MTTLVDCRDPQRHVHRRRPGRTPSRGSAPAGQRTLSLPPSAFPPLCQHIPDGLRTATETGEFGVPETRNRGRALGVLIGALTLGSALLHVFGRLPWREVLVSAAAIAFSGCGDHVAGRQAGTVRHRHRAAQPAVRVADVPRTQAEAGAPRLLRAHVGAVRVVDVVADVLGCGGVRRLPDRWLGGGQVRASAGGCGDVDGERALSSALAVGLGDAGVDCLCAAWGFGDCRLRGVRRR